ncbi:YwiC-like family protein [Corynebacterium guangdongense]|uniref:YwiC-like protein n=1 Tax=Corynebacterium guangdongense TaxID=1783348 RepID=A0ABU1ZYE4_9CORY|nr:YwiC-like family protein [Corynebacterium guangdongense]MDR7329944.1 hypothetical protein [Corynebacterium guangdongense]WJZ18502.1 hypothetical protein CGUA_09740 [Corynebacterium guangdongense]
MATTIPQDRSPATRPRPSGRRKGISPWIPNQHGAWAMLITPAVLGVLAAALGWARTAPGQRSVGDLLTVGLIVFAWFTGYAAFFAFGLVARARTARRRRDYLPPVGVYGALCAAALVGVLLLRPATAVWALPYLPLVAVAVWETHRRRPRSLVSGTSTTLASALLLPVLADVGGWPLTWTGPVAVSGVFLALYFTGTIPFVKTMIRERGNTGFLVGSVLYHLVAVLGLGVPVLAAPGRSWAGLLMAAVLALALARSVWFPLSARRGRGWTARQIGLAEIPLLLLAAATVVLALT